ncbi:MAG: protoheme IX farnesyltransferase, partial [Mesorhizobium sp.]
MALVDDTLTDEPGFRMSEATAGDFFALLKPRVMSLV